MKNQEAIKDPSKVLEYIRELEKKVEQPLFDLDRREDIQVKFRIDENMAPAMFKPDPLIPGGYIANSLTLRAMRPNLFVMGDSLDDLATSHHCACGKELDLQFWKLCPYCARNLPV